MNSIRLGNHSLKIGSGATPRGGQEVYGKSGIALIRSQNVYNNQFDYDGLVFIDEEEASKLNNVIVEAGDVLLNITGDSVARVCQAPSDILPARVNQHVVIIRPDPTVIDPTFLRYFLASSQMQSYMLMIAGSGATRKALTKGMIEDFQIPAFDVSEQREIARILSVLDNKIELNRRMNATLEATARALFKSWFVDFDPVRAKAEGRQPEGMDAETAALFPDDFEESALGLIPVGWRVSTVGDEFKIIMGQSPPGDTYNENGEGMPFYQGRRDFGFRFPTQRVYCTRPTRFAEAGDTLVSVRAPVGDLNMALVPCSIGRGVGAMRHRSDSRSFTYYAAHFLKPYFDYYNGEGTVFGAINSADFRKIPFLYVPSALVEQFDRLVSAFDDSIENNERSNVSLAETRDTLLPKLISGEVRVRSL